jgi:hypothetical protein
MSRFAPLRLDLPWRDYWMARIKAGHDNREVGIDEERSLAKEVFRRFRSPNHPKDPSICSDWILRKRYTPRMLSPLMRSDLPLPAPDVSCGGLSA